MPVARARARHENLNMSTGSKKPWVLAIGGIAAAAGCYFAYSSFFAPTPAEKATMPTTEEEAAAAAPSPVAAASAVEEDRRRAP